MVLMIIRILDAIAILILHPLFIYLFIHFDNNEYTAKYLNAVIQCITSHRTFPLNKFVYTKYAWSAIRIQLYYLRVYSQYSGYGDETNEHSSKCNVDLFMDYK